jgi:hypothetical protein
MLQRNVEPSLRGIGIVAMVIGDGVVVGVVVVVGVGVGVVRSLLPVPWKMVNFPVVEFLFVIPLLK